MKQIRQGQIYLADLNPVMGHEQGGFRPVLIIQNDILNNILNTVIIAPVTTNLAAKGLMTTWFLKKSISGLKSDSVALLYQLRTIDKRRLKRLGGYLNPQDMARVREQISLIY